MYNLVVLLNCNRLIAGTDVIHGQSCQKWQRREVVGAKVNKYTMWLRTVPSMLRPGLTTPVPVHYEMKGFNNLLGSHYDHYYLTYEVCTMLHLLYYITIHLNAAVFYP